MNLRTWFPALAGALPLLATTAPAQQVTNPFLPGTPARLSYAREFPALHYEQAAADNRVARLQQQLDSGKAKLDFTPGRGYLDSLLAALGIDTSSQTLVYSKTSLQKGVISAATPRAIYFNTDTYVGYVQGGIGQARNGAVIEIATLDDRLGQVFYTLDNTAPGPDNTTPSVAAQAAPQLARQTTSCLSCHDTYEMSGGGVPRFLLMSSYVDIHGNQLTHEDQILTEDETPLKYRWGGWYVSGQSGRQVHVGNLQVHEVQELVHLDQIRRGNLDNLDSLFDTAPYPTDKSDIVALLVLQHQVTVQNLITRVNFETRQALAGQNKTQSKEQGQGGLAALPGKRRQQVYDWIDQLADALSFANAAAITDTISGNAGFDHWLTSQGPRDGQGRSLRTLDLHDRLFRYPVSYLIQSPAFDALPDPARERVYARVLALLKGQLPAPAAPRPAVPAADAAATLEILQATSPGFAHFLATHGGKAGG